eukprot:COSAG04_NODE_9903_length_822_cov_0.990318_1_plen_30_part_10
MQCSAQKLKIALYDFGFFSQAQVFPKWNEC